MKNNIVAHRGVFNNKDIPENSIKAFKLAVKKGYSVEFDVHITKDNKLIVIHDDNLFRMTGFNKKIKDCTYDEIKDLKLLNTNEHIPTLDEVLNIVGNKVYMDIELKHTSRIKNFCELVINKLKDYKNYTFKSFNPTIVRYIKKNYKNINVGILISDKYDVKILKYLMQTKLIVKYSKCDFLSINKNLLNKNLFKNLVNIYPTQIWTIENKDEINNDKYTYICNNLK